MDNMSNLFFDVNMNLLPASKAEYIPHASNGFIRIDTMADVDGKHVIAPSLHCHIHNLDRRPMVTNNPRDVAGVMKDFFLGNTLIERVGLDLFSGETDSEDVQLNEDVHCHGEIKQPHAGSTGNVVILSNIQLTEHGKDIYVELLLFLCLLLKMQNQIGWIVIPLNLDYDISNFDRERMMEDCGFVRCEAPGGEYLVWTNHDPEMVEELKKLSLGGYLQKYYIDLNKA